MLDGIALFFIFFMIIALAAIVVLLGSLPGKIARKRGHPHPDAVNAASWIGLATGVFWPVAFIWAFLPCPGNAGAPSGDLARMQDRIAALEAALAKLQSHRPGDAS